MSLDAVPGCGRGVRTRGADKRETPHAQAPWSVSCDFDGTITCEDMVQAMLARFAEPAWRDIEAEWEAGLIGSRTCLARQTELLRVSEIELARWIDQQPIDPQAADLFADCARIGLDLRIVSDGYDWVISRVLNRLGWGHLQVFANRLRPLRDGRWSLAFPHAQEGCASGACKCRIVAAAARRLHIGDGRSDFCVADACEVVFAKGTLLIARRAAGSPVVAFDSFADLRPRLRDLMRLQDADGSIDLRSAVG